MPLGSEPWNLEKISRHGGMVYAIGRQLLACYRELMKIVPVTEGHKIILKSETPRMP